MHNCICTQTSSKSLGPLDELESLSDLFHISSSSHIKLDNNMDAITNSSNYSSGQDESSTINNVDVARLFSLQSFFVVEVAPTFLSSQSLQVIATSISFRSTNISTNSRLSRYRVVTLIQRLKFCIHFGPVF